MKELFNRMDQAGLVSSFAAPTEPNDRVKPVESGSWDSNGKPLDAAARLIYLKVFQGKKTSRTRKLEEVFHEGIKLGYLKIVRRRGKGPEIVWL